MEIKGDTIQYFQRGFLAKEPKCRTYCANLNVHKEYIYSKVLSISKKLSNSQSKDIYVYRNCANYANSTGSTLLYRNKYNIEVYIIYNTNKQFFETLQMPWRMSTTLCKEQMQRAPSKTKNATNVDIMDTHRELPPMRALYADVHKCCLSNCQSVRPRLPA